MESKTVDDNEQLKKKGLALLVYDLKQRKLIPTKILFFVVLSSIGVLLPYMTIHMKSLGISVEETAVIYGVFPLFAILAPYTMGMIADKLGNFKVLLSVTMLLAMITSLLFLAIPTGRYDDTYPTRLSLALGCNPPDGAGGGSDRLFLTDLDSKVCGFNPPPPPEGLDMNVTECGYVCYDHLHRMGQLADENVTASLPADWPSADQPYKKFRQAIFFPDAWSLNVSCPSGGNCLIGRNEIRPMDVGSSLLTGVQFNWSDSGLLVDRMLYNRIQPLRNAVQCRRYDQPVKLIRPIAFESNNSLKCDQGRLLTDLPPPESFSERLSVYRICRPQCLVQADRRMVCGDDKVVVIFDPQLTFWLYLLLRILFAILLGGAMVLFEGACLAVVIEYKGDLGLQRMFGILGTMIFSPISGALIDHFSVDKDIPDYRSAFYLYAVLVGSAAIGVLFVDLDFKPPAKELLKDIKSIMKNVELIAFFLVIFTSGLFWGYIESYLFWFLEEMGGTKSLMGLTVTVSSLFGVPVLLMSDTIFRRIGHPNVQIIGFAIYVIRLIGYSYIYTPTMCLIYEALEAVTTSLMMTSAVAYSAVLSTTTTLATVQGMIGGTYYGIGRGAGSFVGGFLMKAYGTRVTFRILGAAAAAVGFVYFLFNMFYIRRRSSHPPESEIHQEIDKPVHPGGLANPVFVPDVDNVNIKSVE